MTIPAHILLFALNTGPVVSGVPAQSGGQASPAAAPIHVLTIAAGPAGGVTNGTFALSSERSIFSRVDDREVIVYFTWEGVPGAHRLAAQWRSPDGAASANSNVDYTASAARFGAYWSLPLQPTMTLGTWSIEATVDGVPAGRFTFEVTDNKITSAPVKPILTQAQLYEKLNRMFVSLQRTAASGPRLPAAVGFSPRKGVVYTVMSTLDEADDIRAAVADGSVQPLTAALAWNRAARWAVLDAPLSADDLPIAPPESTKVGTRCASMDGTRAEGLTLKECQITGQNLQGGSPTYLADFSFGPPTPGAPVVNEYGELIGIVADTAPIGSPAAYRFRTSPTSTPVIPMGSVKVEGAPATLTDLRSRNVTVPAVTGKEHVLTAAFARADAKGKLISTESQDEISARDVMFGFYVTWTPKVRLRGQMVVRIFDATNRVVAESKPIKADLKTGESSRLAWGFPMLPPGGPYRADVLLDGATLCREFVNITP